MNFTLPIFAYVLGYVRTLRSSGDLRKVSGVQLQLAQIKSFAEKVGVTVERVYMDQTTHRTTRFWLRANFMIAMQSAKSASGRVVVGDLVELLKHFDEVGANKAWRTLHDNAPELASARHFEIVRRGFHIQKDVITAQFKKSLGKKRATSKETAGKPAGRKNNGGKGTSRKSDLFAKSIELELREILKALPDAGSTHVAKELNARGIKSPMGGQWYPSSASNLLARCRKLRIIKI
jgi:hypothetical protein